MKITKISKINLVVIATVVLVGVGVVTQSVGKWRGFTGHHGQHGGTHSMQQWLSEEGIAKLSDRLEDKLDLDDKQSTQVREILTKYADMFEAKTIMPFEVQMRQAIMLDNLSAEEVEQLMTARMQLQMENRKVFASVIADLHGVLTPQQREQVAEMVIKFHGKRGRKH